MNSDLHNSKDDLPFASPDYNALKARIEAAQVKLDALKAEVATLQPTKLHGPLPVSTCVQPDEVFLLKPETPQSQS
jgi:hypothetical protein